MDENEVKKACIEYLRYHGWLVLRINAGAVTGQHTDQQGRKRRRFFNFVRWFTLGHTPASSGVSDILAVKPGRMPLAVETKAPGRLANVSAAQAKFMEEWRRHGGQTVVCDSVDGLMEAVKS